MAEILTDVLIARLAEWGVDTVFGMPGDGVNGIMEGLRRHRDRIRFVLVHHGEAAAFMASGYAKATGRVGVCVADSGAGGTHLVNGLYDAKLDHAPVLAITGTAATTVLGTGYQQEVHLDRLFQDVAEYSEMVTSPVQLPSMVDLAIRTAYARRGVAHLTIPNDLQLVDAGADPWTHVAPVNPPAQGGCSPPPQTGSGCAPPKTAPIYLAPPVRPRQADLEAAAALLNNNGRIGILAGIGALGAGYLIEQIADALAAPIIKTLPGKMVVPDDSPYVTGGLGLLGTAPSEELINDIDTLLLLGTNYPYTKFLPTPGKVRVIQVEADPVRAGNRLPIDVPLIGDVEATLEALLPLLRARPDCAHLEKYQARMRDWRQKMAALETPQREPIAPQYLARTINDLATPDAILTVDSGTVTTWAARHFDIIGDREFYLSGNLSSMGCALPYAIAMQHAFPGRQVIAYVGDGAFAMLMAEFHTAAWHGLPIKVIINNNNSLGHMLWEQMVLGYPEHGVRYGQPAPDYAAWARAAGGYGARVEKAADLPEALRAALGDDRPAVLDVAVDPDEPPLPSTVEYNRARSFGSAFLSGRPAKATISATLAQEPIQQMPVR
jgi:pyruvate dehydrogenase (quinone)/pyruvate oxidase